MENLIYLDNYSTTQIDPRVLDAMMPFLKEQFANASSSHYFGLQTKKVIELAKIKLSNLIDADPKRAILTSGATEAINLAFKSLILTSRDKKHIITLQTEHKAVLETCKYLESIGFEVTYLPVEKDGLLQLENLKRAIRHDTILVSIMWVNSETGVIQDISQISSICDEAGVLFMTDSTQAVGKIPINFSKSKIDFLVLSGHKFYAPKGIGALFYSKKVKQHLTPLIHGGGQEDGLRSGTLNTPTIVGLGEAAEIALLELDSNAVQIRKLRDKLENELLEIEGSFVNGSISNRIFNVSNLCFPNLESDILIGKLKNIAISNGSACSSEIIQPSHVLQAMGLNSGEANASIRFSIGKYNTDHEIELAVEELKYSIRNLQLIN